MLTSSLRIAILTAALAAGATSDAAAQRAIASTTAPARGATVTDSIGRSRAALAKPVQTPRKARRFFFENDVTNVYDSNIEHDSTNIGSYGIVGGARMRFRSRSSKPGFQAEYAVAAHSYTATDKWDRVSHLARAGVDFPLGDHLLLGLTGEASLKGSSEDREIGDQYAVLPRVEFRPWDDVRFRLITAYRQRYYGESSGSNATNRYATLDMRLRMGSGMIEGAARFEENNPTVERNRFQRYTYSTAYTWFPGDRDELLLGLEYRPVKYPNRDVDILIIDEDGELDEIEVPRKDERWKPEASWVREWTRNFITELEYEYEMRGSNDPEKKYRGHVVTFRTIIPW